MPIRTAYPGRAGLLGEHCDWAGGSSLAVPVPMTVTVSATTSESDLVRCQSRLEDRTHTGEWATTGAVDPDGGPLRFVPAAAFALQEIGVAVPPTTLEVTSTLPPGRGFSSSAAFSLAVLDALAQRAGSTLAPLDLADLAYHVERDLLGVECGRLDQIACAVKQPVFMVWKEGKPSEIAPVTPGARFHLVAIAFDEPRDTRAILAALNREFSAGSSHVVDAFAAWTELADQGRQAVAEGHAPSLGAAMNAAQHWYVHNLAAPLPALRAPRMIALCDELCRNHRAVGAKFSGAGGEGSVVALFPDAQAAQRAVVHLNDRRDLTAWYTPFHQG